MLWLALLVACAAHMSDYWVKSVPGAENLDLPQMYAGTLEVAVRDHHESMFFWLQESKYRLTKPKTLFWFNGGPGCSSLDGALLELGPIRFNGLDDITYNEGNWGEYLNVVYLDQPFGTGYSFIDDTSDYVHDVEAAAEFVNEFLVAWIQEFPQHAHDDFYLGGESYAGQYIPYIQSVLTAIDVSGLILCNPWIDAPVQYLSYAPFIKEKKLIDPSLFGQLDKLHNECRESLQTHSVAVTDDAVCNRISDFLLRNSAEKGRCINVYDYELTDNYPQCGLNWPDGVADMPTYLNRGDVLEALHVSREHGANKWVECSNRVHNNFKNINKVTASMILPKIMQTTPVMIMVGDLDFICNINGLNEMVNSMVWVSSDDDTPMMRGWHEDEKLQDFKINGTAVGTVRTGRNLTLARIFNGSHMIPVDKQFETRALVHDFVGIPQAIPGFSEHDDGTPDTDKVDQARYDAYKRAGTIALIVIISIIALLLFWLIKKGEVHISWSSITSGFTRALLHVGPLKSRTMEYVRLDTFRPSGRPSTIIEEDEEEGDV